MAEYEEHPSKVAAWRDGEFVVHPDAAAEDCTVWFATGPNGPDGVVWEGLLCRQLSEDRVRLCAIPFWLYGVNMGDEVTVMRSAEGAFVATGIAAPSTNITFRVILPGDELWQGLQADFEPYACWFDVRTQTYVAISAPPDQATAVADELARREVRGELQFEFGSRT